jgi:hypothetical protein
MVIVPRLSGIRTEGDTLYSVIVTVGASAAVAGRIQVASIRTTMNTLKRRAFWTHAGCFGIFLMVETDDNSIVMHETPNRLNAGISTTRCITQSY